MDETYIAVNGQWRYLYRAVDKKGQTIDFLLTAPRERVAALRFLQKATGQNGVSSLINIDKNGANTAGVKAFNRTQPSGTETVELLQCKNLNNIVEQDHRFIKKRVRAMLCFKTFNSARGLAGVEVIHMIRKGATCAKRTGRPEDGSGAILSVGSVGQGGSGVHCVRKFGNATQPFAGWTHCVRKVDNATQLSGLRSPCHPPLLLPRQSPPSCLVSPTTAARKHYQLAVLSRGAARLTSGASTANVTQPKKV